VSFFAHHRARKRLPLLVYDALGSAERVETLQHVETCARCAKELAGLRDLRARLELDPVRNAVPPVPLEYLVTRVQARLGETTRRPRSADRRVVVAGGLAVAAAALSLLALAFVPSLVSRPPAAAPATAVEVSADALARLERTVAREQAARYLSEAGDVLVSVAAAHDDCDKKEDRVEVGEASARSRDLLARRALLVERDRDEVASAGFVLDDVEHALREVAALPACVRAVDVERFRRQVERRQLLMKIRLLTRELEG
jgi:hypothetical protein